MLDINVIPPGNRNKTSIAAHLELYNRSMDTIRVHNPTDEVYIVYNDRRFSNEIYKIPSKDSDIGFGKGNNDVPQFIAVRYLNKMGIELINIKIREDWNKKKGKFRLEEQGQMEERLALRTNDPALWDEITPILWIGVVTRYQEDMGEEPEMREPAKQYASAAEEALARLNMVDAEIGVQDKPFETPADVDSKKNDFSNQIT